MKRGKIAKQAEQPQANRRCAGSGENGSADGEGLIRWLQYEATAKELADMARDICQMKEMQLEPRSRWSSLERHGAGKARGMTSSRERFEPLLSAKRD
jgi:hypothetical protein